jgi:hypothetical protein
MTAGQEDIPITMTLQTLYEALFEGDLARLRVIANLWNIELITTRKADMVAELVTAMASSTAVTDMLARLTPEQQGALEDVLRHDGALPWAIFVRRNGEVRTVGAGRVEREELWREPVSPAEALWFMGVVYRAFADRDGEAVEMAFIPEDLKLYMPAPAPAEIPDPPVIEAPGSITAGDDTLADDLVTLWSALQREDTAPDPPLATLHPPARVRLALLKRLSAEVGWIRTAEDGRQRPGATEMLSWLQADLWTQWATLADAWIASETWHDLAHVPTLKPDPVTSWPCEPRKLRQAFLNVLAHCQANAWHSIAAFIDYVKRYATDFLRQDGEYDTWAPRDAESGTPLRGFEAWEAVEGNLITFLITGPLFWLGMVDLGGATGAMSADAFRLSGAGAAILDLADPPALSEPAPVRLLAGATLLAPRQRRLERFQLSRIAEPIEHAAPSLKEGYRYRLTPASLSRAKRQHIPPQRIMTFLGEATGGAQLPANLETAIQQAYRGESRARLAHLWILRVSDPKALESAALAPLLVTRLAPELAVVREADREKICQILLQEGILTDLDDL